MRTHVLATATLAACVNAFYLPGVAPRDYDAGDDVPLLVNSMTSRFDGEHPDQSVVSYDYYFPAFKFCQPPEGVKAQRESLGSILFGDRIYNSPFELKMLEETECKILCSTTYEPPDASFVSRRVWQDYAYNWLIDGLPAGRRVALGDADSDKDEDYVYLPGVALGEIDYESQRANLNTHFRITIEYHETRQNKYRVVGVLVDAESRAATFKDNKPEKCYDANAGPVSVDDVSDDLHVAFTYSVHWVPSEVSWATRWDRYLPTLDTGVHWFSLINSSIIVLFLTGIVSSILLRALRKDIARYNEIDLTEEVQEDSGWKLVHGDVFRAPPRRMLLSVLLGSGAQLLAMVAVTLVFALLGFLSPSNRGALSTMMIIFCTFFGIVGGYVSARAYKTFGGDAWKLNLVLTPTVVPGTVFAVFLLLNFLLIFARSSGAVPVGTMIALVFMWFAISIPLSALGGFLGFKRDAIAVPVRTNQIPRQIPHQPLYLRPVPSTLLAGILPFGAIAVELYFILNSIWFHRVYYMFGFLFLCVGLAILTSTTVTIIMVYFMLCSENYKWPWRSFFIAGSCAVYVFAYALVELLSALSLSGFVSNSLYIGYSFLISLLVFVMVGSIGYVATFFFLRKIYASIKVD